MVLVAMAEIVRIRAIDDFSKTIDLDPSNAAAFIDRGYDYAAKQDWKRAIDDYDKAIDLDPKSASAFYYRGKAKELMGDKAGSHADIDAAEKINSKIDK